jgi:hypothetical protein
MSYKYCVLGIIPGSDSAKQEIAECKTKKEADEFIRFVRVNDAAEGLPERRWTVDKVHSRDLYLVTYEHAHGSHPNSKHSRTVWAYNAQEACDIVLDLYWEALDKLIDQRGTGRNAAAYGVRYPYHRHAKRIDA